MMKTKLFIGLLFSAALNLSAQQIANNQKLHQLFDSFYEESLVLSPLGATFNGDTRFNDQLPADDEANIAKANNFYKKYKKELENFDLTKLNKEDIISLQIMESQIKTGLVWEKYHTEYMPIDQMASVPMYMALFGSGSSAQPFNTVKDYDNWLKRCTAFIHWTDVAIDNMRKGIQTGMVVPKSLVVKIIPQLENLAKNDSSSVFYMPTKSYPATFSKADRDRLNTAFANAVSNDITPSMQRLATFFQNEYLPKARLTSGYNSLPDGKEMYREAIYSSVTMYKDPEEVYQLGISEVARITAEMEKIKASIGFKGSLKELFEFMMTDKQFMPFKTDKEVLASYQGIYDEIKPNLPKYFGIHPKTPLEIRKTEDFRAESASAQYVDGDLSTMRPGIFYVPILDPAKMNVTSDEMESLFLHEAIPGHHFQISLQKERTDLPKFRQKYGNGSFVEGWALYTESLGKELGVHTDPYHQLGGLGMEIHRAIRLVVDSGLHTGKMTREEAIKYDMDHEPISEQAATAEIERYMAWPGQALSYKIGELKIKELRDKYKKQLGEKFSIRDFHDHILEGGAMPLEVFESYMDDWAKNVK